MAKEKQKGLINSEDFVQTINGLYEAIQRPERPGFLDNVQGLGWAFSETAPGGELNLEFHDPSLANFLKTADGTTLASFALMPARIYEVARFVSKSSYDNFREQLRNETLAIRFAGLEKPKKEKKSTLSENDLRGLYGDRVVVNVAGSRNKISFPTIYSSDFKLDGSYQGDVSVNFPGGTEESRVLGEGHSENIDDIEWAPGSKARYIFEVKGDVKGARVKRSHVYG